MILNSTWAHWWLNYSWNPASNAHKMKAYLALILFATVGIIHGRRIEGKIEAWTNWLIGNLSVRPAMTASIEYHIRYPTDGPRPVLTFYYDGQDSPNLQQRCNAEMHRQLYNKDLAVPLNGYYYYRQSQRWNRYDCREICKSFLFVDFDCYTTCRYWNCEGSIKI